MARVSIEMKGAPKVGGRWLISLDDGQLRPVWSEAQLRDLIARGRVTAATLVYAVAAGPCVLADVPELKALLPRTPTAPYATVGDDDEREPDAGPAPDPAPQNEPDDFSDLDDLDDVNARPARAHPRARFVAAAVILLTAGAVFFGARDHVAALVRGRGRRGEPVPAAAAPAKPPLALPAPPAVAAAPAAPAGDSTAARDDDDEDAGDPPLSPSMKSYTKLVAEAGRLLEKGHTKRAKELYQQAIAQRPAGAEALTGLAYAYLDRGQAVTAVALFKRALAGPRGHAPALFGLGEAYGEQGDSDAALAVFKRYLARYPSGQEAEMARRQIEQLSAAAAAR